MSAAEGPAVAVVGAGPVGLTLALRLAGFGVPVTVLEAGDRLRREGSKALCMQRETLEVWDRAGGLGERVAGRGVSWTLGRTYYRGRELFTTTFPPLGRDHHPPFVNISQTEVEDLLLARAQEVGVQVRFGAPVTGVRQSRDGVTLTVEGGPDVRASYVVGADGGRSTVRRQVGLGFPGHSFDDRFLVADVRADLPFPDERRFHFDPPFNRGRQVLVHPQPDGVWRIDWQVPPETDVEGERRTGRLDRRIRAVVGDADYELVWLTSYRFHQRLVERMAVGRVFLAGDAAHVMSPFGARGLNSGVADAENLAWKLWLVLAGLADPALLDTYHDERHAAARDNLAVTDATMRFMVPPWGRRWLRNAILRGSVCLPALRAQVDSGRLAQPYVYTRSPIVEEGCGAVVPDGPCAGRVERRLRDVVGPGFVGLVFPTVDVGSCVEAASAHPSVVPTRVVAVAPPDLPAPGVATVLPDADGVLAAACAAAGQAAAGMLLVVRPDGYVASRRLLRVPADAAVLSSLVAAACGGHATPALTEA